ncbi:MAG: ankyrin repeat domain-containing protein [Tatlockia sp.]|nr:ankyrin repeat domain-containing protein [Tatlockia sp.]
MNHDELVGLARALGYTSITYNGLCKGFTGMWIHAACCGEIGALKARMKLLEQYVDAPAELRKEIYQTRQLVKIGQKLDEKQKALLEIPAFFDGIALFLNPDKSNEMMGDKVLNQFNQIEISQYLQPNKLEQLGGLRCALKTTNHYLPQQLTQYLQTISKSLDNIPDVAIDFSANSHSMGVRVLGINQFELIDTNNLSLINEVYNSEELSKKLYDFFLNSSLFDGFFTPAPLVMFTSIFTNQENFINLDHLKSTSPVVLLPPDQSNKTLLDLAAASNDVDTLRRMDFSKIDVNKMGGEGVYVGTALVMAVLCNANTAAEYLLSVPGIDVNPTQSQFLPILSAIALKNYDLAKKIAEHETFNPYKTIEQNNALHALAQTKTPNEKTSSFAQYLITKGININKKNNLGNTPLYEACLKGNTQLVQLFIDNEATFDLNFQNSSPLHAAILSNNKNLLELLLNKGLDCNLRNKDCQRQLKSDPLLV